MSAAFVMLQVGESETWTPGAPPWLYVVGEVGPWVLLALALLVLGRALLRRGRYRALEVLSQEDQAAVHAALVDVERRTVGEVVPVVLERSDSYPGARWGAALATMLIASALLERWLPWGAPHWLLLSQIALGAVGFALASLLPDVARRFVSEERADEMAAEEAFQEFFRLGLHETRERTGVLLFVSLFEHRVVVLGDRGIDSKVGTEHWVRTREAILAGIARGSLRDGLVDGIRASGDVLAEHFPWVEGDRNEVPDRLVVRRE